MTLRFPSAQAGNEIRAAKADRIAGAVSNRLIAETERQHVADDQTVWPAPEALHLATAVIRRGYLLPETMEHPIIKFECINLAYLFMAWGLPPTAAACRIARDGADTRSAQTAAP